jgi:hypothetical protein
MEMMKALADRLIGAALLLGVFAPAAAQQFSADIVTSRDNTATPAGRLWVRDTRVRIETPALPDGFFLVDGAAPFAHFVRPATRVYMDARQSSRLTQLFVPVDPADPCRNWRTMGQLAGAAGQGEWRCERTGRDDIKGRGTDVFRVNTVEGSGFVAWLDPERRFPLQIATADGSVLTLQHIREEPQPASWFELPPHFRKFDPQALIERIRRSDVWVAEPEEVDPSHP